MPWGKICHHFVYTSKHTSERTEYPEMRRRSRSGDIELAGTNYTIQSAYLFIKWFAWQNDWMYEYISWMLLNIE